MYPYHIIDQYLDLVSSIIMIKWSGTTFLSTSHHDTIVFLFTCISSGKYKLLPLRIRKSGTF